MLLEGQEFEIPLLPAVPYSMCLAGIFYSNM